jgi:RND family efflux transporter MFP subunit
VAAGQPLLRIDARDLAAKRAQVEAAQAEAQAVLGEAELHVRRMRALHAEEAAPRAQLDAAETAYARAMAAVAGARATAAELAAVVSYAEVRAPFAGTVARRMVDPGSFATPGAPLIVIQDARRLRVVASAPPEAVRGLARGAGLAASIEGAPAAATVEGVVPGAAGLFTVNAIVDNVDGRYPATGAATLSLPRGTRRSVVIPSTAVRRQGDLTGVDLRGESGVITRWVKLGPAAGDSVEVLSGVRDGDRIFVPAQTEAR